MNLDFWKNIKYFKQSEFKYPDKISQELVIYLDEFREAIGKPVIIHSDYRPNDKGQHGLGLAVDIHVPNVNVIDQFLVAEKMGLFKRHLQDCGRQPGDHSAACDHDQRRRRQGL